VEEDELEDEVCDEELAMEEMELLEDEVPSAAGRRM
jgi:hypothetical protein